MGGVVAWALVVALFGGCGLVRAATGSEEPVLVTAAEKEQIGYELPEGVRNSALQRKALEHRKQIYSVTQPYIEEVLVRPVEMGAIIAS